jgi:hypothetical protein
MKIQNEAIERITQGAEAFPVRAMFMLFEMPGPEWEDSAEGRSGR